MNENLLHEIWHKRSLITLFAFNEVKLRYRNSFLGFLWTFLEPLLMLSVLYFVFTNIFKSQIENYPIFLLLGLIIWYMFSRSTTMGLSSLLDKGSILQKVYFRREIVVISSVLAAFIIMGFEFLAFGVFVAVFHFTPPATALLLPVLLIDLFVLSLGISLLLSVLNVYFRDIKFIWQFLLQAGFFLSPIIYNLNTFSPTMISILKINPLVSLFDIAHDLVMYGSLPNTNATIYLLVSTAVIFLVGYSVFRFKSKGIVQEL